MKANSCGLEVVVKLTDKEITNLEFRTILGELNFREVREDFSKKILMSINYASSQREFVKVSIYPSQVYFGDSKRIDFFINKEFYDNLIKRGYMVERFGIIGNGKLEIIRKD